MNQLLDAAMGHAARSIPVYPAHWLRRGSLSWVNLVGRGGIEPPTLRFSVAGRGVQQGAGSVMVLVRWHLAKQAYACLGRVIIDRDVDRRGAAGGQRPAQPTSIAAGADP
jgi:hypothetical protein